MKRPVKAIITGILITAAFACLSLTPWGQELEENYGLALLFTLRGPRKPPDTVLIVNVDEKSPGEIEVPPPYSKWSRTIHARLVERLAEYGAAVIAFDILFVEEKDAEGDAALAKAVDKAGNVVLVQDLQHTSVDAGKGKALSPTVEIDCLISPYDRLADSALGLAPFPLPKIPVKVTRTWRFKESCGDLPTLPVVVFQAYRSQSLNALIGMIRQSQSKSPENLPPGLQEALETYDLSSVMRNIRTSFLIQPELAEKLQTHIELNIDNLNSERDPIENVTSLINLYAGKSSVGIDFYGPPFTLPTISYQKLLAGDKNNEEDLEAIIHDRAVFVGAARNSWSNQKDGFYTVFSRPDGLDISGVELAATVFSNLAENRSIITPSAGYTFGLLFFVGFLCYFASVWLSPFSSALFLLIFSACYIGTSYTFFALKGIALPIILPAIVLPALIYLVGVLTNFITARRERRQISTALGYYVPGNVVEELSRDLSYINKGDERTFSICLMSDAQNYTTLSESISPEELSKHMKGYYRYLFPEVKRHGGVICNIIGDSMLAHWPSVQPDSSVSTDACLAALAISSSVDQFNLRNKDRQLPTRIGLHAGYLVMDNIGAEDHYEYAPVGDIVNTVSRIEGLNKTLGTQILASSEVVSGVKGVGVREVGSFLLSGKTKPIAIYEIVSDRKKSAVGSRHLDTVFQEALDLFRSGDWQNALKAFNLCLSLNGNDGPSRFYRQLCESYLHVRPPANWQGFVRIDK